VIVFWSGYNEDLGGEDMRYAKAIFAVVLSGTAMGAFAAETVTYKYDAKGRLVKVTRSGSVNNGVTTDYTHDKADNRKRVVTTGSAN
jgi:hypothetical protein